MDQTSARIAFIEARLDDDERLAREAIPALLTSHGTLMWPDYQTFDSPALDRANAYLERFEPNRALREVEAKRKMLDEFTMIQLPAESTDAGPAVGAYVKMQAILDLLAGIWSDHDDYAALFPPSN